MDKVWSNKELDTWLATSGETKAIFPGVPIVDPHHHVFPITKGSSNPNDPRTQIMLRTFARAPLNGYSGLDWEKDARLVDIHATVYAEAHVAYDGQLPYPVIGEVKFARANCEDYNTKGFCKGLIAPIDLTQTVEEIETRIALYKTALGQSGCILSGVRAHFAVHDVFLSTGSASVDTCVIGARAIGDLGLVLDVWLYHGQVPEIAKLASLCPNTTIVCDHIASPVGTNDEVFKEWGQNMLLLAKQKNVCVKLGEFSYHLKLFQVTNRLRQK